MDWSSYTYLAVVAACALAVGMILVRFEPRLAEPQDQPHQTPSEVILLLLVMGVGLAAIYGPFYRETRCLAFWDVGSDTVEQYVPYYLNLIESLRTGTLGTWNFDYGLGVSFMSYQSWTLDPFNLVLIPLVMVLGTSRLALALVITHSVKLVVAALLLDRLLCWYCRMPLSRLLGAALFGLCGYLVLWGQHYWLGATPVLAVALLVALELLMERWTLPRFWGVLLLCAASLLSSTYGGFMIMLFAATYALFRVAHACDCHSLGSFVVAYLRLALPAVCGCLVAGITLVPYASLMLTESTRVVSSAQAPLTERIAAYAQQFVPVRWILPILSRTLGCGLITTGEAIPEQVIPATDFFPDVNAYEFVVLGLSCGALVLLLQFAHWMLTDTDLRDRIPLAIASLLVILYCGNTLLPALSNVFATVRYRASFAVDILACIAMAVAWEQRVMEKPPSLALLALGGALTVGVIGWSLLNTVNGRLVCLIFLLAAVALVALLWRSAILSLGPWGVILTCFVLVMSSVVDGFFVTNLRATTTRVDFPLASNRLEDLDTHKALSWIAEQDRSFYRVEKLYPDFTRLNDSLIEGFHGVASYNSTLDSDIEEFYTKLWPGMVTRDTAYQVFIDDPDQQQLCSLLGVRYLLAKGDLDFSWCKKVHEVGDVRVYECVDTAGPLTLVSSVVPESTADALDAPKRLALLAQGALVPDDQISSAKPMAATTGTSTVTQTGSGSLRAEVETSGTMVGVLAVPHTAGWEVSIDGRKVDTFRADYGFIGFEIPRGTHTVKATYVPVGMLTGVIVSVAGLVAGIVCSVVALRRR